SHSPTRKLLTLKRYRGFSVVQRKTRIVLPDGDLKCSDPRLFVKAVLYVGGRVQFAEDAAEEIIRGTVVQGDGYELGSAVAIEFDKTGQRERAGVVRDVDLA